MQVCHEAALYMLQLAHVKTQQLLPHVGLGVGSIVRFTDGMCTAGPDSAGSALTTRQASHISHLHLVLVQSFMACHKSALF